MDPEPAAEMQAPAPLVVTSITLTAAEPLILAQFYARLLAVPLTATEVPAPHDPPEAGWAQLRTGVGSGRPLTLNFEFDASFRPPVWPSVPGRQTSTAHLDIWVQDLSEATAHAIECGAVLDPVQPQERVRVMRDPAGHPFCLFA